MKIFPGICLILLAAGAAVAGVAPGEEAPGFTLTDTAGHEHVLADYLAAGRTVVLEWFNPDCPFVKKHRLTHKTMEETFAAVKEFDVVWLAINSSAEGKQGYGTERNVKAVTDYGMTVPVLLDATGDVGRAYGAKTTPHMFVILPTGQVAYAGAIDDNPAAYELGGTNYVADALAHVLAGEKPPVSETRPYGCSVKYDH